MKKTKSEQPKEEIILTDEQIANNEKPTEEPKTEMSIPWLGLIVIGAIILMMVACIIVIAVNGGF